MDMTSRMDIANGSVYAFWNNEVLSFAMAPITKILYMHQCFT